MSNSRRNRKTKLSLIQDLINKQNCLQYRRQNISKLCLIQDIFNKQIYILFRRKIHLSGRYVRHAPRTNLTIFLAKESP